MAHSKSALKTIRQDARRRARNRVVRGTYRNAVRVAREALEGNESNAAALVLTAQKELAIAGRKGVLHAKTVARRISRLSLALNKVAK
jgi:small subunit ribosomal protein S20